MPPGKKTKRNKFKFSIIQLWQLETLLLQRDTYMNYSRQLSSSSTVAWSPNVSPFKATAKNVMRSVGLTVRCVLLENWQRTWILLLWVMTMGCLFAWKLNQYKNREAFQVMGYCLAAAKGAAETLKLNMALILLPVCRNMLTWLRSTRARLFIPFDDNINFHKVQVLAVLFLFLFFLLSVHMKCAFKLILLITCGPKMIIRAVKLYHKTKLHSKDSKNY